MDRDHRPTHPAWKSRPGGYSLTKVTQDTNNNHAGLESIGSSLQCNKVRLSESMVHLQQRVDDMVGLSKRCNTTVHNGSFYLVYTLFSQCFWISCHSQQYFTSSLVWEFKVCKMHMEGFPGHLVNSDLRFPNTSQNQLSFTTRSVWKSSIGTETVKEICFTLPVCACMAATSQ